MLRAGWVVVLVLLCAGCGGGIDSYGDAMDAQVGLMEDLVSVLEGVTDEKSAEAATPRVQALGEKLAEVAKKMSELPPPEMEEMQELATKYGKQMQEFQGKAASQLMKLGQYPELMEAYTNAMMKAQ